MDKKPDGPEDENSTSSSRRYVSWQLNRGNSDTKGIPMDPYDPRSSWFDSSARMPKAEPRKPEPAAPADDPSDRRQAKRLPAKLPALVSVVFPRETFSPHLEQSFIWNVSSTGAMTTLTIPDKRLRRALYEEHYCRIQIDSSSAQLRVIGKIVWIQCITDGAPFTHEVGIEFKFGSQHEAAAVEAFLTKFMA